MKMRLLFVFVFAICTVFQTHGQYEFTGQVDAEQWQGTLYLSLVKDYHKLEGIYPDQIINRATVNEDGTFVLRGNNLPTETSIYKIHIDSCPEELQATNHMLGYCKNNREIPFIAGPKDKIHFPTSASNEIFCTIATTEKRHKALLKIDSLKELAAYDLGSAISTAAKDLEAKKWLKNIRSFSKELNEPLAELYAYSFISNRSGALYPYYLDDVAQNDYYSKLGSRLEKKYPNSLYTNQFTKDLQADTFLVEKASDTKIPIYYYVVLLLCLGSLFLNGYFLFKRRPTKKPLDLTPKLTPQEQKVIALIQKGKTNKEIASTLFVSLSTVKTHINNGYKKLGVSSRDELKLP